MNNKITARTEQKVDRMMARAEADRARNTAKADKRVEGVS